jgi:hypothetical protein
LFQFEANESIRSPRWRPVQIDREGVSKKMGGTKKENNLKKASANDLTEENRPLVARVGIVVVVVVCNGTRTGR